MCGIQTLKYNTITYNITVWIPEVHWEIIFNEMGIHFQSAAMLISFFKEAVSSIGLTDVQIAGRCWDYHTLSVNLA